MKLFWKIYLQVLVGMLVLSLTMMGYLLWESQKKTLEDTARSEVDLIRRRTLDFEQRLWRGGMEPGTTAAGKAAAVEAFRHTFGSGGILRLDEEELFNVTPYEFDWDRLEQMEQEDRPYTNISLTGPWEVAGRRLLVFYNKYLSVGKRYSLVTYLDVTGIFERTEALFFRGCAMTLLLLLVLGTLLYRGIYRVLRPMLELKLAAASIADGRYGIRIPVGSRDEIQDVTVSFNRMAEKVEEHIEALEAANEKQRQLLGSLAHELKTPMTAIIGYADTLLTVRLPERGRERALAYIRSEGRRLARLSEKMLELTGLYESGEEKLDVREVRAAGLLQRLENLTAFRLREKELRMEKACTPEELVIRVDEDLMLSLLMNLVDNSCKASAPGSVIRVTAEVDRIMVEDSGRGIPEAELPRVTEAFYMADKSRAKCAGSVGLGLSLCSQIAKLHGGALEIESREGEGTRVTLWLHSEEDLAQRDGVGSFL